MKQFLDGMAGNQLGTKASKFRDGHGPHFRGEQLRKEAK